MDFNPDLYNETYRIPTTRWQDKDYGEGFYHVVVCTKERRYYFGKIDNDEMYYSPVGEYARKTIESLTRFYPYCTVLEYQVMPNHIHLLLRLLEDAPVARRVETVIGAGKSAGLTVSQNPQRVETVIGAETSAGLTVSNGSQIRPLTTRKETVNATPMATPITVSTA